MIFTVIWATLSTSRSHTGCSTSLPASTTAAGSPTT
jgi:hypothetical protein